MVFYMSKIFKNLVLDGDFFPQFNFEKFERLLTEKSVLSIVHGVPSFQRTISTVSNQEAQNMGEEDEETKILREYRNKVVAPKVR